MSVCDMFHVHKDYVLNLYFISISMLVFFIFSRVFWRALHYQNAHYKWTHCPARTSRKRKRALYQEEEVQERKKESTIEAHNLIIKRNLRLTTTSTKQH